MVPDLRTPITSKPVRLEMRPFGNIVKYKVSSVLDGIISCRTGFEVIRVHRSSIIPNLAENINPGVCPLRGRLVCFR